MVEARDYFDEKMSLLFNYDRYVIYDGISFVPFSHSLCFPYIFLNMVELNLIILNKISFDEVRRKMEFHLIFRSLLPLTNLEIQ